MGFWIAVGAAIGAIGGLIAAVWPFAKKAESKNAYKLAVFDAIADKVDDLNTLRCVPGYNENLDADMKDFVKVPPYPFRKSKKPRPPVSPKPPRKH